MMYKEIVDDLKMAVNGRLVLTPSELEAILGISVGQQANMRSKSRFPILHKKIGAKVVYPVHSVAKHLASSAASEAKQQMSSLVTDKSISRTEKKKLGNHLAADWYMKFRIELFAFYEKKQLTSAVAEVGNKKTRKIFRV